MTTETYRGVRLRLVAGKGHDWGYVKVRINGHGDFRYMERDEERLLSMLRATIDHAQAEPDRYDSYYQSGHKGKADPAAWQGHRCADLDSER